MLRAPLLAAVPLKASTSQLLMCSEHGLRHLGPLQMTDMVPSLRAQMMQKHVLSHLMSVLMQALCMTGAAVTVRCGEL